MDRYTIEELKVIPTDEIDALLETYLDARREAELNRTGLEGWKKNYPMPPIEQQYDSTIAYNGAILDAQRWLDCIKLKERDLANADEALKSAEAKLMAILPYGVWIRRGDLGIGKAYTNWGGNRHYIEVRDWQAEMPRLNHTYSGD